MWLQFHHHFFFSSNNWPDGWLWFAELTLIRWIATRYASQCVCIGEMESGKISRGLPRCCIKVENKGMHKHSTIWGWCIRKEKVLRGTEKKQRSGGHERWVFDCEFWHKSWVSVCAGPSKFLLPFYNLDVLHAEGVGINKDRDKAADSG